MTYPSNRKASVFRDRNSQGGKTNLKLKLNRDYLRLTFLRTISPYASQSSKTYIVFKTPVKRLERLRVSSSQSLSSLMLS